MRPGDALADGRALTRLVVAVTVFVALVTMLSSPWSGYVPSYVFLFPASAVFVAIVAPGAAIELLVRGGREVSIGRTMGRLALWCAWGWTLVAFALEGRISGGPRTSFEHRDALAVAVAFVVLAACTRFHRADRAAIAGRIALVVGVLVVGASLVGMQATESLVFLPWVSWAPLASIVLWAWIARATDDAEPPPWDTAWRRWIVVAVTAAYGAWIVVDPSAFERSRWTLAAVGAAAVVIAGVVAVLRVLRSR